MKKGTIIVLGVIVFIISIVMCVGIMKLNNDYKLEDYFVKICGGDSKDKVCVYTHSEYNPFTYKHTFYYQVSHEEELDENHTKATIIQKGSKKTIEEIVKVANNHNADNWIELGDDILVVKDENNYRQFKSGDIISKEDLYSIVEDMDNN